jgi:heat shock protein HtpX
MPLPAQGQLTSAAHLMIPNPFSGGGLAALFSTHPRMEDRVRRLREMAAVGPTGPVQYLR